MFMILILCVWLCGFYYGAFRVECLSSCSSVLFNIVITSIGEVRAGQCASRAFVCLFCTRSFLSYSLPLGVRGWLRLVIVALAEPFN